MSSNLVTLIEEVRTQRARLLDIKDTHILEKTLQETQTTLNELKSYVYSLVNSFGLLRSHLPSSVIEQIQNRLDYLYDSCSGLHHSFLNDEKSPQSDHHKQVITTARELLGTLHQAWKDSVRNQITPLISQYDLVRPFMPQGTVTEFDSLLDDLMNFLERTPSTAHDLGRFDDLCERLRRAKEQTELTPEVEAFLQRIQSEQATLADVTPTIWDWFSDHGLLNRVKLIL